MAVSSTIALVFDFDDTLVPDSTTLLLKKVGIDPEVFWGKQLKRLIEDGYDPTLGFLKLFLDLVGIGLPLGSITNADLRSFGATLDQCFQPGLPGLFSDLKSIVKEFGFISIEFYVVSGGLQAVIEGSKIISEYFTAVYGCELAEEGNPPMLRSVKRAINFTEKTRYLFEINKGLPVQVTKGKPYLVNKSVADSKRRVPFTHMIYVGDGLTDIPCFSLLKKFGGTCFGVFDPKNKVKAKQALLDFLKPRRVISMHAPHYDEDSELGSLLRAAVSNLCSRIVVEQRTAEFGEEGEDL